MEVIWNLSLISTSTNDVKKKKIQSNLDYLKCQGPQESFRIIGSLNDRKREFSDIFGIARMPA